MVPSVRRNGHPFGVIRHSSARHPFKKMARAGVHRLELEATATCPAWSLTEKALKSIKHHFNPLRPE
eukprot:2010673-Amphidinium_carterae.1